jgi:thiamine transport system substrate-binding protein
MATVGVACGAGEAGERSGDGSAGADAVVLLTYDAFALPEEAATAFEEATGHRIEVIRAGDSGAVLAGALLTAGSPDADVIFGIDDATAAEVASAPLLEPYRAEGAGELDPRLEPPAEVAGELTPVDTSEVCLNLDTAWFARAGIEPPSTIADLTEARYRSLLVVESPVSSSPGLAFLLGTVETLGDDGWEPWWQAMRDNDVRVAPSWDDAYYNDYTVNGGNRPIVLSYASSPPAEVVFSEGARTEPASTVMADGCVTQVEHAGVLAGAEHPEAARALVDFMLTEQWQSALPLSNFVYPVTDAALPEEFLRWAPRPVAPVDLSAGVLAARDEIVERWRSVME